MRKGKICPEEVEKMFQEAREKKGITPESEALIVEEKVEEATQKLASGQKAIVSINPIFLHVPDWQRDLDLGMAMQIATEYDPYKFGLPLAIYKDRKLYMSDGMTRATGALKSGMKNIQIEIMLGRTEKEAGMIFIDQSKDKRDMTPADRFNAAIIFGVPEYVQLKRICGKHHVAIKGDRKPCENPVGLLTSISDGLKTAPELLDRILELLGELQWNAGKTFKEGKAYGSKPIRVLKSLYAYYAEDSDKMEKILLKYCKGGTFFTENLSRKYKDSFFDFLAEIIESHMQVEDIASAKGNKTKMA